MKILLKLAVIAALCPSAFAQVPVCTTGCTITAISSPTAKFQVDGGGAFSFTILPQVIQATTLTAQKQSTSFTVTYTLNGATVKQVIPATAPPAPTTTKYLITCKGTALVPSTSPLPATLPITGSSCTAVKQ